MYLFKTRTQLQILALILFGLIIGSWTQAMDNHLMDFSPIVESHFHDHDGVRETDAFANEWVVHLVFALQTKKLSNNNVSL
jgi:hypothetical protein